MNNHFKTGLMRVLERVLTLGRLTLNVTDDTVSPDLFGLIQLPIHPFDKPDRIIFMTGNNGSHTQADSQGRADR